MIMLIGVLLLSRKPDMGIGLDKIFENIGKGESTQR